MERPTHILKTSDYKLFKQMPGNRVINHENVDNIVESIKKNNKLHVHPIIVNEEMYVIDGQHRLVAAVKLNVPIYYVVSSGKDELEDAYEHIMSANINQKSWSIEDFLHLYAIKNNDEDYKQFIAMMSKLKLRARALIGLIFGGNTGHIVESMKIGKFKMPDDKAQNEHVCNQYLQFQEFVQKRKLKPFSMFTTYHFCSAFRMLLINESCEISLFFSKLENRWFELKPQGTSREWFKILIGIYNWKNSNKIEQAVA